MMYITPNPLPGRRDISSHIPSADQSPDPVETVKRRNEATAASWTPPPDEAMLIYAFLREEMQRRDIDLLIMAPAYAHGVWTDIDLMMVMLLSPETAHEHFALATKQALTRIEHYIELDVDMIGIGGDFSGNRPMISKSTCTPGWICTGSKKSTATRSPFWAISIAATRLVLARQKRSSATSLNVWKPGRAMAGISSAPATPSPPAYRWKTI
jgi:hypothetical protein